MSKKEIEKNTSTLKDVFRSEENEFDKKAKEIAKAEARIRAAEESYNKAMSEFSSAAEENDIVTYKEAREKVTDTQAVLEFEKGKLQRIQAKPVITPEICQTRIAAVVTLVQRTVQLHIEELIGRIEEDKATMESLSELYDTASRLIRFYKCDMAGLLPTEPKDIYEKMKIDQAIESIILDQAAKDLRGYLTQTANSWFYEQYK